MSDIVRLNVPPFEHTPPTSLAALRRPLVAPDKVCGAAHCTPCPTCESRHQEELKQASKLASDLGLRLSQLVEDALDTHLARIETEQAQLTVTVLKAVLPHLSDANLRSTLVEELAAINEPLRDVSLILKKHPDLDLGAIPDGSRLQIHNDPNHPRNSLSLSEGDGQTAIEPMVLIEACLARLSEFSPSAAPES